MVHEAGRGFLNDRQEHESGGDGLAAILGLRWDDRGPLVLGALTAPASGAFAPEMRVVDPNLVGELPSFLMPPQAYQMSLPRCGDSQE